MHHAYSVAQLEYLCVISNSIQFILYWPVIKPQRSACVRNRKYHTPSTPRSLSDTHLVTAAPQQLLRRLLRSIINIPVIVSSQHTCTPKYE